ncbi:MAG: C25 family cysteine peptidase, partial [Fidelibacterota bacterium]
MQVRFFAIPAVVLAGGLLAGFQGESLHHRVSFDRSDLVLGKERGFDVVHVEGTYPVGEEGTPRLPVKTVFLVLPQGAVAQGVRVTGVETVVLDGDFVPLPVQKPGIPGEVVAFTEPSQDVYTSPDPYPSTVVRLGTSGHMSGYAVAAVLVAPVQYLPADRALLFHESIEFDVDLALSSRESGFPERQVRSTSLRKERFIQTLVENPEDVILARPPTRRERLDAVETDQTGFSPRSVPSVQGSPVDYLIVTSEELKPAFEVLAEWKTQKGVPAVVRTLEEIKGSTPAGADDAQTLRRFIARAREKWGVTWLLLGGDVEVIPARYVEVDRWGTEKISDLYYGDLDGNWNADGDAVWAERSGDQVDFYFDLFVGRAPVETVEEAEVFVAKSIDYDRGEGNHLDRILYMGEKLWPGDGKYYCERVDAYASKHWLEKTRLYESDGTEDRNSVLAAMDAGQNLIFNVSHGNAYRILVGPSGHALEYTDMYALGNTGRYSIFYNVTCNANDISYSDSFSEWFMLNAEGGGVGYIGSTWLDYPSISILQNEAFFKLVFEEDDWRLGSAFG